MHRVKETFARDVPREGAASGASREMQPTTPGRPECSAGWDRGRPESTVNRPRGSAQRCFSSAETIAQPGA